MGEIADALRQADQSGPGRSAEPVRAPDARVRPPSVAPLEDAEVPTVEVRERAAKGDDSRLDVVPLEADANKRPDASCVSLRDPQGSLAQQYRRLAFRVRELASHRAARSIVVTSAQAGDGKTTTACNLAFQLVKLDQGSRVALIDLDFHRASIAGSLGIAVDISLDSVIRGECSVSDALLETDLAGLSILAQRQPATDADWLLANPRLKVVIHELESRFDFVIIDTPPVLATSDAQVILRHAAAGLLVVRAGLSRVKAVRNALEHVPAEKLLGSILNSSPMEQGFVAYPYYGEQKQVDVSGPASDVRDEATEQLESKDV